MTIERKSMMAPAAAAVPAACAVAGLPGMT